MYETKEGRKPKAPFYVSTANGGVYPAMRNVPGYEDDNPAEWRVATADEVEAYKRGDRITPTLPADEVVLSAPAAPAAPSSIQLAEDDAPPAPQAVLQQAAAALPPAAPTTPAPADPPPLPPTFNGIPGLPPTSFGQNG